MPRIPLSPQKNIQNTSTTLLHGTRNPTATSVPTSGHNVSQTSTSDELPAVWHDALDSPLFPTIQTTPPKQGPIPPARASAGSEPSADDTEKKTRVYRRVSDKLDLIGEALKEVNWSLGDFLHYLSEENLKTRSGKDEPRSESSTRYLSEFLLGRNSYHAIDIVQAWFKHSYSRPKGEEREMMYSTDVPAKDIKGARAAISSFAAQLVEKQLIGSASDPTSSTTLQQSFRSTSL